MGKAKKAKSTNKAAVKASKKEKQAKKVEQKSKKQLALEAAAEEEDLLTTLEEFRALRNGRQNIKSPKTSSMARQVVGQMLLSLLTQINLTSGYLVVGEFFNGSTAHFYNDLYRYSPEKNEWRRYSSPTFPGPRSTHQMVATPAGGGKLWLFGGEFASSNQTTFHHYRDMWCFDLSSHSWERIETKVQPSARSGHRMAVWKQWIILFGVNVGVRTNYLNDLWFFDMMEYKWQQIPSRDNERWPRSVSHYYRSLKELSYTASGYSKTYITKSKAKGVALDDTFFLKLDPTNPDWLKKLKWEKRKRVGQVPNLRSGSTMVNWVNKAMAIGFGGVLDLEDNEEGLVSEFYNDLYAYQLTGNGRWMTLNLKRPKKKKGKDGGGGKKRNMKHPEQNVEKPVNDGMEEEIIQEEVMELDEEDRLEEARLKAEQLIRDEIARSKLKANLVATKSAEAIKSIDNQTPGSAEAQDPVHDDEDPEKTIPLARFNPMLAILKNTLYMLSLTHFSTYPCSHLFIFLVCAMLTVSYGGIYESGDKEYTLQSFYSLALDKLDRYICLRDDDIHNHEWYDDSESGSDDEDSGSDGSSSDTDSHGEEEHVNSDHQAEAEPEQPTMLIDPAEATDAIATQLEQEELKKKVEAFMGVAKSSERSIEDMMSTPLPGETLKLFYDRTREVSHIGPKRLMPPLTIVAKSFDATGSRMLKKDIVAEYKPLLEEIERIQAEAGIEASDVQRRTGPIGAGAGGGPAQDSRHRR
ncbi:hypothetical protein VP01_11g6 [Puccinia sorghi]|uniref:DUF4110 domain-containing protein n=1 Tax=Puccinia sorghi TaxID=27349 RepID=A0A0L6VQK2_9BASI|nr:hypothetical protein VP01_11g6 [Puccinia sorghi]